MKSFVMTTIASSLLLLSQPIHALPNAGNPTTFLGTIGSVSLNNMLSDTSAFSVGLEGATHHVRLDGSYGWRLIGHQQLKLSAEYLLQNISYSYYSGNTAQWVQQGAVSADYQFALGKYLYFFDPQILLNGYASRSPGKSLRVDSGSYTKSGSLINYIDNKRIAGADALGIGPGISLAPREGTRTYFYLNYDNISYDTVYIASQNAKGLGGTVRWQQAVDNNVELNLTAAIRNPFNAYQADLSWQNLPLFGFWTLGANGAYTAGKNRLPSTYSVGIHIDYLYDDGYYASRTQKDEALQFLNGLSGAAVYIPEVFAIADERVTH